MAVYRDIMEQYDTQIHLYDAFAGKIRDLLSEILNSNQIRIHSLQYRLKDENSLTVKLFDSVGRYSHLNEVTDIAGIRIITYFHDDVYKIADLIEQEFKVDRLNSIDKKALLAPDRFGYLSMHHIVSLSPARSKLTEYKRFRGLKAEIQTRSILQHSWAEIEHDLGYKSKQEIPKAIMRRFFRLASLLEIADQEFVNIRDELGRYERDTLKRIESTPQLLKLDKTSLNAFVCNNKLVDRLDRELASIANAPLCEYGRYPPFSPALFKYFQIETIADLATKLEQHCDEIIAFAIKSMANRRFFRIMRGISLHYLTVLLIASTRNVEQILVIFDKFKIGPKAHLAEDAQLFVEIYESILNRQGTL